MNLYPNIMIYRVMVFSDFGDSDFNYNNGKGEREGVLTFGLRRSVGCAAETLKWEPNYNIEM